MQARRPDPGPDPGLRRSPGPGDSRARARVWLPRILGALALLAAAGLLVQRAVLLVGAGGAAGTALGVAVLVVLAVGLAAVAAEVRFGARSAALADRLAAEGGLPEDVLARTPSGRVVRAAADADFDRWRDDVEVDPADWRRWYRLALAYDAARDRRRARAAARRAIALARGG